jgi:hypothetical protein
MYPVAAVAPSMPEAIAMNSKLKTNLPSRPIREQHLEPQRRIQFSGFNKPECWAGSVKNL